MVLLNHMKNNQHHQHCHSKSVGCTQLKLIVITWILVGCVPDPQLNYPEPSQDFGNAEPEPRVRADARPTPLLDMNLDMDLDVELDKGLEDLDFPPDANVPPSLRTVGLDFVGEVQTTYNSVEPIVRGRYLWTREANISPKHVDSKSGGQNKRAKSDHIERVTKVYVERVHIPHAELEQLKRRGNSEIHTMEGLPDESH